MLREDKEVVENKMINHIDEIIKILKDVPQITMADIVDAHHGKGQPPPPPPGFPKWSSSPWT